jgi:hypothetical protein
MVTEVILKSKRSRLLISREAAIATTNYRNKTQKSKNLMRIIGNVHIIKHSNDLPFVQYSFALTTQLHFSFLKQHVRVLN